MNRTDAEEYTESLGQIVAGSWRQIALARRLGVPKALGMSTEQWVNERLGGYVRMSIADRREAVLELTAEGASQRDIADVLGVDAATVNRDVANATADTKEPKKTKENTDGDVANATPSDPAVTSLREYERQRQEQRWAATLNIIDGVRMFDRPLTTADELAAEFDPAEAQSRKENITPARLRRVAAFVNALADAMEKIDEKAA